MLLQKLSSHGQFNHNMSVEYFSGGNFHILFHDYVR